MDFLKKYWGYFIYVIGAVIVMYWWYNAYHYSPEYKMFKKLNGKRDTTKVYVVAPRKLKRKIINSKDTTLIFYNKKGEFVVEIPIDSASFLEFEKLNK